MQMLDNGGLHLFNITHSYNEYCIFLLFSASFPLSDGISAAVISIAGTSISQTLCIPISHLHISYAVVFGAFMEKAPQTYTGACQEIRIS